MMHIDGCGHGYPDTGFIDDLVKALNGEYSAILCYEKLAKQASSAEEQKRILEIRTDEIKHYRVFANIYRNLTGRNPEPRLTEECPENYRQGLAAAFEDEQKTVDFYNEVADKVDDLYIKKQFRRFAVDEQNHAVWFSYFYFRNCN
jgi:rubrerythrin